MILPNRLSAHLLLNPLVGAAFLHGDSRAAIPAGLELVSPTGEKFRTTEAVKFVGSGGPVEIPLERDAGWLRDQVRHATELFSRVRSNREAVISQMPTQRWHQSDLLERGRFASVDPIPYKRCVALSFVDDYLDVIPTGSQAVAENFPVWEENARVVLAGAKRWAQLRWGGL